DVFTERLDDELTGLSADEILFAHRIRTSIRVNDKGNLEMPLPFKSDHPIFPDNRLPVLQRTRNTLGKLSKEPNKLTQCFTAMGKNLAEGHVEPIPPNEI
ncbi:hypothetical protein FHG87_020909, partial [Trinorchestia longiramus]